MLDNWKPYIHPDDFIDLSTFVLNTQAGKKERKICILFGETGSGKSTFINQLRDYLGNMNVHCKQIGFLKRPSTGMAAKLIVVDSPEHYEFDDCVPHIKEYLSDEVIYRRPYTIQTKANIIIITNDLHFFDDFTPSTKEIFRVIRFTHKF
jgi:phage/plasmid-associated DNA primase